MYVHASRGQLFPSVSIGSQSFTLLGLDSTSEPISVSDVMGLDTLQNYLEGLS